MGYCVSFSTTPLSQLQLWHVHWLVFQQSGNDLHSRLPLVLHFLSHEESVPVIEARLRLDDVFQEKVARIFLQQ
jgi:hypothetical protein